MSRAHCGRRSSESETRETRDRVQSLASHEQEVMSPLSKCHSQKPERRDDRDDVRTSSLPHDCTPLSLAHSKEGAVHKFFH